MVALIYLALSLLMMEFPLSSLSSSLVVVGLVVVPVLEEVILTARLLPLLLLAGGGGNLSNDLLLQLILGTQNRPLSPPGLQGFNGYGGSSYGGFYVGYYAQRISTPSFNTHLTNNIAGSFGAQTTAVHPYYPVSVPFPLNSRPESANLCSAK